MDQSTEADARRKRPDLTWERVKRASQPVSEVEDSLAAVVGAGSNTASFRLDVIHIGQEDARD